MGHREVALETHCSRVGRAGTELFTDHPVSNGLAPEPPTTSENDERSNGAGEEGCGREDLNLHLRRHWDLNHWRRVHLDVFRCMVCRLVGSFVTAGAARTFW